MGLRALLLGCIGDMVVGDAFCFVEVGSFVLGGRRERRR